MDTLDIMDRAAELKHKAASLKAVTNAFYNEFIEGTEEKNVLAVKAFQQDYIYLFRIITDYVADIATETAAFSSDLEKEGDSE